ncbi:calpain clp-1-like [Rhipicephalus microplus]|uniref:calpain clp-1-like n=1 Tax=Rhipicephalus microplus TaxID=6941 RepID=UPI001888522E|nr:calpain clp-1-like [Rhipicephalus microplus]
MGCGPSCSVTAWHPETSAHDHAAGGHSPRAVRVWPIRPAARVGPDASGYRSSQGLAQDSCCRADDTAARPDSAYEASSVAFELPDVHSLHPLRVTKTALEDEQAIRNLPLTELFVDSHFPPAESSLFTHRRPVPGRVTWLRPHEMVSEPQLLVNGVSRNDIVQGALGDCWFLSSCAAVAQRPDLMHRVVPQEQQLYGSEYKGAVRFNLWRFGRWVVVYVDDLLPTSEDRLIYSRCSDPREFWVALLEKAYAKLHGSYEALEGGQAMDAMVDLTSGLAERYDLQDAPENLFGFLLKASEHGAFITCSRKGDWWLATTADPNGLVSGHAYTVSAVRRVALSNGHDACLLRVRNPWGNGIEWTGSWSDADPQWSLVDAETKKQMEWRQHGDGEFWMKYEDFCREFEEVSICTLGPDFDGDGIPEKPGEVRAIRGVWVDGVNSGGSRNNLSSFSTNPQYLLSIRSTPGDHGNAAVADDSTASVVVALMQVHPPHNAFITRNRLRMHQIGFVIYQALDHFRRLSLDHFARTPDVANSGAYINYREVFGRFELRPGHYVIIPATFDPHCPGAFMIRVYASNPFQLSPVMKKSYFSN